MLCSLEFLQKRDFISLEMSLVSVNKPLFTHISFPARKRVQSCILPFCSHYQYPLKGARTCQLIDANQANIKTRPEKLNSDDNFFREACNVSDRLLASREKFKATATNQTRPHGSARITSSVWYFFLCHLS